jgi:hypothetical protein
MEADQLLAIAAANGGVVDASLSWKRRYAATRRLIYRGEISGLSTNRPLRAGNALAAKCLEGQAAFHNLEQASKRDFELRPRRGQQGKREGSGKWKQRTAAECGRIIFKSPADSMASIARSLVPKGSERACTDLLFGGCHSLLSKQSAAVRASLSSASFAVFQLMFDETQFRFLVRRNLRARASDACTFAAHGRLLWGQLEGGSYQVHEDEVIIAPSMISVNSAAGMWEGFRQMLPVCLWQLLEGRMPSPTLKAAAICPANDQLSANCMLLARAENLSPDNIFILKGFCKQHGTGNCLGRL